MNLHFVAWMSITGTFVLLGGGAYVADALYPHHGGFIDIWGHSPNHRLAHAFFFYGGIYAACNFVHHLFGLRRARNDLRRTKQRVQDGFGLAPLVSASRARPGTGADGHIRLGLDNGSAPHAFERALRPRLRDVSSGARALATAAVLMMLAGSFAMVMECTNAAHGIALTGVPYQPATLGWIAAAALQELATGMLIGITCFLAFFTLREGVRDAARDLEQVVNASERGQWLRVHK